MHMAFVADAEQMEVREMKRIREWLKADFGFMGYKMPVSSAALLLGALAFLGLGIANYAVAESRTDVGLFISMVLGAVASAVAEEWS